MNVQRNQKKTGESQEPYRVYLRPLEVNCKTQKEIELYLLKRKFNDNNCEFYK